MYIAIMIRHYLIKTEYTNYNLTIENLNDELKFETVRNLYNNLTLEELQEIENKIKIRII